MAETLTQTDAQIITPDNLVIPRGALSRLDDDEKGIYTVNTLGGKQDIAIVSAIPRLNRKIKPLLNQVES